MLELVCQLWVLYGIVSVTTATVGSDHPCNRPCEVNTPELCVYNFTVENYFVLSRACYNCPFNYSDCFRPHCVSTNGLFRHLLTVNRQLPGPSIEVCKGDTIRVWVHNQIDDGVATSMHWHGLHQRHTNFMDGVPRLTQCNIAPFETFRYEFTADNAGTHWWHSHTGFQTGDGLHGAFVVREPDTMEPSRNPYDLDESHHIMVINDWAEQPQIYRYMEEMQHRWATPKLVKVLVNGRGRKHEVTDFVIKGDNKEPGYTPYEVFTVMSGNRYRFRVIGAATRCYFRVMVDNHEMTVIASDGMPMTPTTVGSFMIHPGERYDFVLAADKPVGDYWIKIESFGDCITGNNDGHGAAILHYDGYNGRSDFMPADDVENFVQEGVIMNPISKQLMDVNFTNVKINQSSHRYDPSHGADKDYTIEEVGRYDPSHGADKDYTSEEVRRYDPSHGADEDYTSEEVGLRYYMTLRYQGNDNAYYSHPEYYPQHVRWGLITPTINNLTLSRPTVPLATQWDDAEKNFCNTSTIDTTTQCNDNLCLCTHMLDIPKGQVVELFMAGAAGDPHQMHLHGHTFRVVGTGYLVDPSSDDYKNLRLVDIKERDASGEFPRNLINPWYKDTVTVNSRGGYAIVRFKADNPGVWLFHCHNDGHMIQGMAMVMKVGDPKHFPKPPSYHPTCGGYSYEDDHGYGTSGVMRNLICVLVIIAGLFAAQINLL